MLLLGGQGHEHSEALNEVAALTDLLSEGSNIDGALLVKDDKNSFRNLNIIKTPLEIYQSHIERFVYNSHVSVSPHNIIANARSRVWQHIQAVGGHLETSQIFTALVDTLESEVSRQFQTEFIFKSERVSDLSEEQIAEFNDRFVTKFIEFLDQYLTPTP